MHYGELKMGDVLDCDFRLLDVSMELIALEDFLAIIEKEMESLKQSEKHRLEATIKGQDLSFEDWSDAHRTHDEMVEFLLPRFFRGPFLVAL